MTTHEKILVHSCKVTDNDCVNNVFLVEIIFILKTIKSNLKGLNNKQNLILLGISNKFNKARQRLLS